VAHYMMGGVDTDITAAAPGLPGLFAAGECACVSINGANRLGSNSLTELVVFGRQAGRSAARFAAENPVTRPEVLAAQAEDEQRRVAAQFINREDGTESIARLKVDLNRTMEEGAGIYRTSEGLRATCDQVLQLKERFRNLRLDDRTASFNTELTSALELEYMLDVAEAVAFSAYQRRESRGAHQRTDYPQRDDGEFLRHSLAYRTDDEPRVEYRDVTITSLPPAERVYGR